MAIQFLDGIDFNGTEITSVLLQNSVGTPGTNLGGGHTIQLRVLSSFMMA
jgi:hypothetical protein